MSKDYDLLETKMNIKYMILIFKESDDKESIKIARKYFNKNYSEFSEVELIYILRKSEFMPNNLLRKIDLKKLSENSVNFVLKHDKFLKKSVKKDLNSLNKKEKFNVEDYY